MATELTFFPVGNGDMTLISLGDDNETKILIDCNIRDAADNPDDDTYDAVKKLREKVGRDSKGRPYVDAFLLGHPDQDHCNGFTKHFYIGKPSDYPDDNKADEEKRIFIRELWSSPMVFRRASKDHTLCDDASDFNTEARRRVKVFRDNKGIVSDGDRILILGEDENGKTDDLQDILVRVNEQFNRINGKNNSLMIARLLGPFPKSEDDEAEEKLSKNDSSTILQFSLAGDKVDDKYYFLTGGDAGVAIWEKLWETHSQQADWLSYDVLLAPHHCSWRSLSYDSWSDKGESAQICEAARNSLSQAREGAIIIASSKPIKDDNNDPPCIRAKREYKSIADECKGTFECMGERPSEKKPDILEIEITKNGPKIKTKFMTSATVLRSGAIGGQPLGHG
jgi:hypothetical protein